MDRSDQEKKAAEAIRANLKMFRARKPDFKYLALMILDDSEREANKYFRLYHELRDRLRELTK